MGKEKFCELVRNNSRNVGLKLGDLEQLSKLEPILPAQTDANYLEALDAADFNIKTLKDKGIDTNAAIKYILDRKQSRKQY